METGFLRAICEDPYDHVSRRIFADWLLEQNDPALNERGEFIQLQFALAEGAVPRERFRQTIQRQRELLERHREAWEAPIRGLTRGHEYRHGFAERVTLDAVHLVGGFQDLVQQTPVARVQLHGLHMDTVTACAEVSALSHLHELELNRQQLTTGVLQTFLASPNLTRLSGLNVSWNNLGDEGVRIVVNSRVFPQLHFLNLSHVGMTQEGLRFLLNALTRLENLPLRHLVLRGAPNVSPQDLPPLPEAIAHTVRQSIEQRFDPQGRPARRSEIRRLHLMRPTLPEELRRWVDWLHAHGALSFAAGLEQLPIPEELGQAFVAVCRRRVQWKALRFGVASIQGQTLVELVFHLIQNSDPEGEATALCDSFLDLYQRHLRGELPPDGRTRWRPQDHQTE